MRVSRFSSQQWAYDIFLAMAGPQSKRSPRPSPGMLSPLSATNSSTSIDHRRPCRRSFSSRARNHAGFDPRRYVQGIPYVPCCGCFLINNHRRPRDPVSADGLFQHHPFLMSHLLPSHPPLPFDFNPSAVQSPPQIPWLPLEPKSIIIGPNSVD